MKSNEPHFVLIPGLSSSSNGERRQVVGGWRFRLQRAGGGSRFEVSDEEPGVPGERLELLAVVRGLEALDQPSRVTLVTRSRYIRRGLREGLACWRENGWQWERFGRLVPVRDRDLWQRVDRALRFHRVECRQWRFDGPHVGREEPGDRGAGDEAAGMAAAMEGRGRGEPKRRPDRSMWIRPWAGLVGMARRVVNAVSRAILGDMQRQGQLARL